jgi:hypothetical protein
MPHRLEVAYAEAFHQAYVAISEGVIMRAGQMYEKGDVMAPVLIGGLLGLLGTLLGAGLTTWTARQTAERSERRAHQEVRRQEFRVAVTRFATTLLTYRVAEMARWHARHGGWQDEYEFGHPGRWLPGVLAHIVSSCQL